MKILIDYAMSFLGTWYKFGGNNRLEGIDCSGFVQEILKSAGAPIIGDHTALGLYKLFSASPCKRQTGALAFYGKNVNAITHVALMVDPYRIIEAGGGDSATITIEDAKKRGAMVRIRPLTFRGDLLAIAWPNYPFIAKET